MTTKMKRFLGILLSLALVLGLVPGMSLAVVAETAYDDLLVKDSDTNETLTGKVVKFNGIDWYIIKDESTALNAGTVTLLAKNCLGASKFANIGNDNTYKGSLVEGWLSNYYSTNFSGCDDAVKSVTPADPNGNESKLYLLSENEIPSNLNCRKCDQATGTDTNYWWLRSPYPIMDDYTARCVDGGSGDVGADNVRVSLGVRPALKLNLSSVIFESESKTFSLKPAGYSVTLSGGANATTSGGATSQTGLTGAMTTVTYTANTGYYFAEFADITDNNITATRTSSTVVTVSGTPTADATITVPDAVEKTAATVTKAPTAKSLTYTGSAQELVTAGEATGGTMQYALGTDATTAPTSGWGTAIPTGTDAGTYYVWYKAVGDADHADSDPKCVEVTIEDDLKDRIVSVNISGGIYRINITQGYATFIKPNSNPGKSFRVLDEAEYSGTKYPVIGIEPEAFKDLKDLETVTLGAKIQEIGQDAFAGSKVKYVHYAGIKAQWKKIKIGMGNDPLKKATRYYKSSGPITKLTLSKTSKTLKVGKTLTLTAKTTPKNAAPKFKWTSSKPNIASVKNGVVKAKKSGKTTITCEALDGSGLKVKCKIQVK